MQDIKRTDEVVLSGDVFGPPVTDEQIRQRYLDLRGTRFAHLSDAAFAEHVEQTLERRAFNARQFRAMKENPPRGLPVPVVNRRSWKGYAAEALRQRLESTGRGEVGFQPARLPQA